MSGGYVPCACRDCFEIAIQGDEDEAALCHECEEAGCHAEDDPAYDHPNFNHECCVERDEEEENDDE